MDESEAPASSDLSEELQCAFWGLPLARVGPLRACLARGCVVCGAERRAEFYAVPEVRDAAGYFAGLVRMLAYSSLPLPDVAAAAAAWWGRQLGVRPPPPPPPPRPRPPTLRPGAPARRRPRVDAAPRPDALRRAGGRGGRGGRAAPRRGLAAAARGRRAPVRGPD